MPGKASTNCRAVSRSTWGRTQYTGCSGCRAAIMAAASGKMTEPPTISEEVSCEDMNSHSIIEDVLGRCSVDHLLRFMNFHCENFVNEQNVLPSAPDNMATV